jgi:DNA-3-methyladenine glycosylase
MFGRAGHAYVYFTYGNHWMLNVTCGPEGECGAVLLRAALPVSGVEAMWSRRPRARTERDLLSGPGKLAAAIGIDGSYSGSDMLARTTKFRLVPREEVRRVLVGTRIGLSQGMGDDKRWRFIAADDAEWASRPLP